MDIVGWCVSKAIAFIVFPVCKRVCTTACVWAGKTIGGNFGKNITSRGYVTLTLGRSKTYIVSHGEAVIIDPRKKYTIERGELIVVNTPEEPHHNEIKN